jgi:hypothetical protein
MAVCLVTDRLHTQNDYCNPFGACALTINLLMTTHDIHVLYS